MISSQLPKYMQSFGQDTPKSFGFFKRDKTLNKGAQKLFFPTPT